MTTSTLVPMSDLVRVLNADHDPDRAPRYVLGLTSDQTPIWWDPATGGPLQILAGTGGGATTLLRSLALQALRTGATVDVIEVKGHGWNDLADLDGMALYRRAGLEGLDLIQDTHEEAHRRVSALLGGAPGRRPEPFPGRFLIIDDLDALLMQIDDNRFRRMISHTLGLLHTIGAAVGVHLLTRSNRPHLHLLTRADQPHPPQGTLALTRLSSKALKDLDLTPSDLPPGGSTGQWLITPGQDQITAPAAMPGVVDPAAFLAS